MIKNFYLKIKKIFSRQATTDKSKWEPNPRRDWALVIICFLAGLVISLAAFGFLYLKLIDFNQNKDIPVNLTTSVEKRNLNAAMTEFKNKEERFKNLDIKPQIVVPSL